jgi:hypothetical protein
MNKICDGVFFYDFAGLTFFRGMRAKKFKSRMPIGKFLNIVCHEEGRGMLVL